MYHLHAMEDVACLALLLAAVALGVLVAFMWVTASGGGPA